MIVASQFPGDDNDTLQLIQHDAYNSSLNIIIEGCYRARTNARELLGDFETDPLLGKLETLKYDHRHFQSCHDYLAAYWRFVSGYAKPQLPYMSDARLLTEWQEWLHLEIQNWALSYPTLIQSFCALLSSQEMADVPYLFEKELMFKPKMVYPISIS